MLISKLYIQNFRSIGPTGLTIDFNEKENFSVIIGSNNAGKSNILDALSIVLGKTKNSNHQWSQKDFYNYKIHDESGGVIKLRIEAWLSESSRFSIESVYGQTITVHGFVFELKAYERGEEGHFIGELKTPDHFAFGSDGKPIIIPEKIYKKGTTKVESEDTITRQSHPAYAKDYLWKLGKGYFLDIQNIEKFFSLRYYSPLSEIIREYEKDFPNPENKIKIPQTKSDGTVENVETTNQEAFDKWSEKLAKILKTQKLANIQTSLSKHIADYLGFPEGQFVIDFATVSFETLFENIFELKAQENELAAKLPILENGTGYLSLFRLSVIQTIAELKSQEKMIFFIEEPEIYLHTHLQRFFYETIKKLAKKGHQIFFTTHSPNFLSFCDYRNIIHTYKDRASNTTGVFQIKEELDFTEVSKTELKLLEKGNKDIFFAKTVLLLEGKGDKFIFQYLLSEIWNIQIDLKSISIVDCGSIGNIRAYIDVCMGLGVDCFSIFDGDNGSKDGEKTRNNIKLTIGNDNYFELADCLEVSLGNEKGDKEIQRLFPLVDGKNKVTIEKDFPEIATAANKFVKNLI